MPAAVTGPCYRYRIRWVKMYRVETVVDRCEWCFPEIVAGPVGSGWCASMWTSACGSRLQQQTKSQHECVRRWLLQNSRRVGMMSRGEDWTSIAAERHGDLEHGER